MARTSCYDTGLPSIEPLPQSARRILVVALHKCLPELVSNMRMRQGYHLRYSPSRLAVNLVFSESDIPNIDRHVCLGCSRYDILIRRPLRKARCQTGFGYPMRERTHPVQSIEQKAVIGLTELVVNVCNGTVRKPSGRRGRWSGSLGRWR